MRSRSRRILSLALLASACGLCACSAILGFEDLTSSGNDNVDGSVGDGNVGEGGPGDGGGGGDGNVAILGAPTGVLAGPAECVVSLVGHVDLGASGVAVDDNANVYVSNQTENTIVKMFPDGGVTPFAGTDAGFRDGTNALFHQPTGIALSLDGKKLLVADTMNEVIREVTLANGVTDTLAGRPGVSGISGGGLRDAATFTSPAYIAVSDAGILVADAQKLRLIRNVVDPSGSGFFEDTGMALNGVAAPPDPSVLAYFITGAGVFKYDSVGVNQLGPPINGFGNLVTQGKSVYVANSSDNNIVRIDGVTGNATLAAGTTDGGTANSANGPCESAGFDTPLGITSDRSGNLYVITGPFEVRKITGVGEQLTVSWTPPAGADSATSYAATAASVSGVPGSCSVVGGTSCTIGPLTSDAPYTVAVTATNAAGTSIPATAMGTPN